MTVVIHALRSNSTRSLHWLNIIFTALVVDILFTLVFLVWSQYSTVLTNHVEADGAVLLFAGMGNQSRIDESYRRINQAYGLYQAGTVKEILSVGGYRSGVKPSGSQFYQTELGAMGIPEQVLSAEGLSYDTQTNIRNALSIIEDKHWKSVVFISSPTHLMRVKHYLNDLNLDVDVYYSAYEYINSQPEPGMFDLWRRVHSEWAIYLMYNVLDQDQFGELVRTIRLGSETTKV